MDGDGGSIKGPVRRGAGDHVSSKPRAFGRTLAALLPGIFSVTYSSS